MPPVACHAVLKASVVPPPGWVGYVAAGAVLLSFVVSVAAVMAAHSAPDHTLVETLWSWIPGGLAQTAIVADVRYRKARDLLRDVGCGLRRKPGELLRGVDAFAVFDNRNDARRRG